MFQALFNPFSNADAMMNGLLESNSALSHHFCEFFKMGTALAPVIGAFVGSMCGGTAGECIGNTVGTISGFASSQQMNVLALGDDAEVAVFGAGRRGGIIAGTLMGCVGGTTTGVAVGVIYNDHKN